MPTEQIGSCRLHNRPLSQFKNRARLTSQASPRRSTTRRPSRKGVRVCHYSRRRGVRSGDQSRSGSAGIGCSAVAFSVLIRA